MAISSPLTPKTSEKTIKNLQGIILNKTKVSRETFRNKTILQDRRIENDRRAQAEEVLEAPKFATTGRSSKLIGGSSKGFFDRILTFLGYVTAGWIINNLPSWISMGKGFVERTQQMGNILGNFIKNSNTIFNNLGGVFSASLKNLAALDFIDTSNNVENAFNKLNLSVKKWGKDFEDIIKLITTPLSNQPLQTPNEDAYPTQPTPTSPSPSTTYSSTGGIKIKDVGGVDYGEYNPSKGGSRASARVHGDDGRTKGHTGEDYPMRVGTPLSMIAPGTIVDVERDVSKGNGYGKFIVVKLDDGTFISLRHLSSVNVNKGERVGAGSGPNGTTKVVGYSGNTGFVYGDGHLHVDHAKNITIPGSEPQGTMDPKPFIERGGIVIGTNVKATSQVTQPASQPQQTLMGNPSSSYTKLFNLIGVGEGGYESMNRGRAGDSPDGAKKYLGKNLQDMTISEIMSLQSKGKVSAVGKYQIVTETMPGFVKWLQSKGYDPKNTKYSAKIQDLYPQYTIESKRPQVGKFLSGSMNDIQKANLELAAEFASVGVPFDMKAGSYGGGWPKYDIKKGESLYAGFNDNRASITPEKIQDALIKAKSSGGNTLSPSQSPPAQLASQSQSQSQISQSSQTLTPERTGPTVIVAQNPSSMVQQMMSYGGGGSSGGGLPQISEFDMLNNFIRNKLLLDLAYL